MVISGEVVWEDYRIQTPILQSHRKIKHGTRRLGYSTMGLVGCTGKNHGHALVLLTIYHLSGPYNDGIFTQSSLGIVVKMGIW